MWVVGGQWSGQPSAFSRRLLLLLLGRWHTGNFTQATSHSSAAVQ